MKYFLRYFPPDKKPQVEEIVRNAGYEPFDEADNPGVVFFHSDKSRKELILLAAYGAKLGCLSADDD